MEQMEKFEKKLDNTQNQTQIIDSKVTGMNEHVWILEK